MVGRLGLASAAEPLPQLQESSPNTRQIQSLQYSMKRIRKWAIVFLKAAISIGILSYLVWDAVHKGEGLFRDEHGFNPLLLQQLVHHAADRWYLLLAALTASAGAVLITFIRWWLLIRALGTPIRFGESLRLSFVGFLLNLAPMGIVGGDMAKAILVARRFPGHRPESVASVLLDRILGLYVLFITAGIANLLTGFYRQPQAIVQTVSVAVVAVSAVMTVGLIVLWAPDATDGAFLRLLERLPLIGSAIARLAEAIRRYRHNLPLITAAVFMTFPVHLLTAFSIFLISSSMFPSVHSVSYHFVMVPVSASAQVLPVSIGPTEFVLDRLYASIPLISGETIPPGQGLLTMLVYRVITLIIAAIGVGYYLSSRQEWTTAMDEAEAAETDSAVALESA
ncbi:MAG: lysylphosphatidylglycerol synthase transmembrane domain-containing protein [Thermogutta sp.]